MKPGFDTFVETRYIYRDWCLFQEWECVRFAGQSSPAWWVLLNHFPGLCLTLSNFILLNPHLANVLQT
jgi:hypothetical protein